MTGGSGRLVVIAFRGAEIDSQCLRHVERVARDKKGMILMITEKDLRTFIRQALNGKSKEDHINELYDRIERAIG